MFMVSTLKKVLIAEDEQALAKVLALKLKSEGYEPVIAGNGEEAVSQLRGGDIALLILDLVMPKMDGFSVLEAMKKESLLKVPVIVTSNLSQDEDIARAKKMGAVEFFVKSDTPLTVIVAKVKTYLH